MMAALPNETWIQIFELAIYDDRLQDTVLPDATSTYTWFKPMYDQGWTLRSPTRSLFLSLQQRYKLLKAISSTSRVWRQLASAFLFTFVGFSELSKLRQFHDLIQEESYIAKWIRRIYIMRYLRTNEEDFAETSEILSSMVNSCRGLELLFIDLPLMRSFPEVADSLCTHLPRRLQTLCLHTSLDQLRSILIVLDTLSASLLHIYIEIRGPDVDEVKLGMMSGIVITFPRLRQLLLYGRISDLVEEASSWEFPSLEILTLNCLYFKEAIPDVEELLRNNGSQLTHLDVDAMSTVDLPSLAQLCPRLESLSFNGDWHFSGSPLRFPHPNITFVGLHGLRHAFGVGWVPGVSPHLQHSQQHHNDNNMRALSRTKFPKLDRVRVLDNTLLQDLEAANGPSKDCYRRYEWWWDHCIGQGFRLEDCTGADLGTLPDIEQDDESEVSTSTEYEEIVEEETLPMPVAGPLAVIRGLREELQLAMASLDEDLPI